VGRVERFSREFGTPWGPELSQEQRVDRVHRFVDAFLEERRESDGGWAPITHEDITLLNLVIRALVWAKCGADPDGDRPIEWKLIDRTRYGRDSFLPVRYPHDVDGTIRFLVLCFDPVMTNLRIAAEHARSLAHLYQHMRIYRKGDEDV